MVNIVSKMLKKWWTYIPENVADVLPPVEEAMSPLKIFINKFHVEISVHDT